MLVELPLQDLVGVVDTELLEAIRVHDLEPEDVQDADEAAFRTPLLPSQHRSRRLENQVDLPVDPREQLAIDVLEQRHEVLL